MNKAFYRLLLNWYQAADKPLPAWLENACARHPELAKERREGDELTHALKKRPNEGFDLSGDSMASRVLRQITEEDYLAEQQASTSSNGRGAWVRMSALAAAACVVVVVVFQWVGEPDPSSVGANGQLAQIETETIENLAEEALALEDNWKNPLDQEIEYIVADAKGAIDFLATKFVPSSMLKKAESDSKA